MRVSLGKSIFFWQNRQGFSGGSGMIRKTTELTIGLLVPMEMQLPAIIRMNNRE
jgi:hypothetical protein